MHVSRRGLLAAVTGGSVVAASAQLTGARAQPRAALAGMTGLDVSAYGAVGDGVTDDTAAIQAALDDASSGTYPRRVELPAGVYLTTATLTGIGGIELTGEGPERTVVIPPAAATGIRLGSLTQSQPHGLVVRDFTFRGDAASTAYPMLDIQQYGRKWVVERVHFSNNQGDTHGDRPADKIIHLVSGGGHSIRGLVMQGAANNEITTGVHCGTGIAGVCKLDLWKSVGAAGYLTSPWVDDSANKLVVTAA